jgi:tetratricopeptide (TPR) repeat protein
VLSRVHLVGFALAVASLAFAVSASAQNPLIQQGQAQIDELSFEEALQTLSAALVRPGNTTTDQAAIYRLLAYTYFALERETEAEGAYRLLLALDPSYTPGSDVAPRFREFFVAARERWEADGRPGVPPPAPVSIRHRSPAQAEIGQSIELTAELDDPSDRVQSLVLAYRRGSADVFLRRDTEQSGAAYRATLPGDAVAPPLVEYYFEALDATGLPIASRGDVAAPLRIAVPEESFSIFEQWWFWVGAVAIVAGGVTLAIVLATSDGGQETPGTFVINVR